MSLSDYNGASAGTFNLNGYAEAYAANQTVIWVNDTHDVSNGGWWWGPYQKEPAGSFYAIFEVKLVGVSSSTTIDHAQDSYSLNGVTFTSTSITGTGGWNAYALQGATNLTSSSNEYRGGTEGLGSFTKMEFRGVYLAYYSGNPTNNEQNPAIASMPTFTTSSQIMFTYHIQVKSFNNQIFIIILQILQNLI